MGKVPDLAPAAIFFTNDDTQENILDSDVATKMLLMGEKSRAIGQINAEHTEFTTRHLIVRITKSGGGFFRDSHVSLQTGAIFPKEGKRKKTPQN